MKFLLDTSVIVEHLRGKQKLKASFVREGSVTSIITQAELFYGAYRSTQPQKNLRKIREMLVDLGVGVINLSGKILDWYAKTKVALEKKGGKIDEFDLLIAATALGLNLTVVTRNIKHFQRIPKLKLTS